MWKYYLHSLFYGICTYKSVSKFWALVDLEAQPLTHKTNSIDKKGPVSDVPQIISSSSSSPWHLP